MYEHYIEARGWKERISLEVFMEGRFQPDRVVCLSGWDIYLIRLFVRGIARYPTFFGDFISDITFGVASRERRADLLLKLNELDIRLDEGENMSDISEAIASIASALGQLSVSQVNNNNCGGCSGTGGSSGAVDGGTFMVGDNPSGGPIYGTKAPASIEPGEYPEGFDSLEEYQISKCEVSNLVADGIIGTLRNLGAFGVFNATAALSLIVLSLVGMVVFPPTAFILLAASIGVLATEVTILTVIANKIQEHREELVCILYRSDSVEVATSLLADFIDEIISLVEVSGPIGATVKGIFLLLCNSDTLNQLFEKVAHLTYPDADCASCVGNKYEIVIGCPGGAVESISGTLIDGDLRDGPAIIQAGTFYFLCDPVNPQGRVAIHSIGDIDRTISVTVSGPISSPWAVEWDDSTGSHYEREPGSSFSKVARGVRIREETVGQTNSFQVEFSWEDIV